VLEVYVRSRLSKIGDHCSMQCRRGVGSGESLFATMTGYPEVCPEQPFSDAARSRLLEVTVIPENGLLGT